ncbi:MAG TPA: glycosyltransferase family 2 protein, partial [Planctomycetota bacterium]|nr:glycosyltransferase family 2 protein [Planctomycetota bacterium]
HAVLINNDAELEADTLERLVAEAERRPAAAFVGAAQRLPDGSVNGPIFHFRWSDGRVHLESKGGRAVEEPFIAACVMLVRREAYERLGGLDETFFMYCEDVEWSMRARRAGYELGGSRDIVVRHGLSQSSGGGDSPFVLYYNARNRFKLAPLAPAPWRFRIGTIARSIGQARRRARRGDPAAARAILAGTWEGVRGRFGRGMKEAGFFARLLARVLGLGAGAPTSPA